MIKRIEGILAPLTHELDYQFHRLTAKKLNTKELDRQAALATIQMYTRQRLPALYPDQTGLEVQVDALKQIFSWSHITITDARQALADAENLGPYVGQVSAALDVIEAEENQQD